MEGVSAEEKVCEERRAILASSIRPSVNRRRDSIKSMRERRKVAAMDMWGNGEEVDDFPKFDFADFAIFSDFEVSDFPDFSDFNVSDFPDFDFSDSSALANFSGSCVEVPFKCDKQSLAWVMAMGRA